MVKWMEKFNLGLGALVGVGFCVHARRATDRATLESYLGLVWINNLVENGWRVIGQRRGHLDAMVTMDREGTLQHAPRSPLCSDHLAPSDKLTMPHIAGPYLVVVYSVARGAKANNLT